MAKKENKNLFQKLTKLFRSGPIVKRKIRTLDTAVAVPDKTKSSGALLFQKSSAPTYATITANAYNLSERLMRYQDFCFSGDTLVATPNKEGCIRIDEIVERWNLGDKDIWTFSYDEKTKSIVSSKITNAKCNGKRHIVSVTLDDGSVIRCTPDHRFMLKDGSYVEAQNLKSGTALMRFSRADFNTPYRYIQTHSRGWKPEHVLVAEAFAGRLCEKGEHVHHKNFKHRDNHPKNLEIMSEHDHMSFHAKINNLRFEDPKQRENLSRIMKSRWEETGDLRVNLLSSIEKTREGNRERRIAFNKSFKPGRFNKGRKDQIGILNGNADKSFTYQDICNSFCKEDTLRSLSSKLGVSEFKIKKRLNWEGFRNFSDFSSSYENHKVVSVVDNCEEELVYDIEVKGYSNFALAKKDDKLGAQGIVIVHNCEMEYTPELAAALDIYADETCASDEKGRVLHIYSDNEKIKEILEDLFYDTLNVEFNLRSWVRNIVKYGDFFLYNDVSPTHGVINAFPIPVNEIEREENYDPNDPMAVRFRWVTLGNRTLENWEISHFRLLGNDMFLPYGSSVIEPARRIWRQLILIEDAMLVYRVVRAPERRVFYIDVANIPPENVPMYVEEQKKNLRSSQVIDRTTGRVDLRYNPLSVDEDYFIPVRGGESGTKIDTLAGGQNTAAVEDVAYIQKKLFAALKIPRAYLGYDEALCLLGSNRIPLLDGRILSVEELVAEFKDNPDKSLHVYSSDAEGGIRPGKILNAWKTKDVDSFYRITLDDGQTIDCTDNHPFLCRDGLYRRADELQNGQSLMALRRKKSNINDGDFQNGYEKVFDNSIGEWEYTHRVVARNISLCKDDSWINEGNRVIHHVDFDKRNNDPTNLIHMGRTHHAKLHAESAEALKRPESRETLRRLMKTEKYIRNHRRGVQKAWDSDDGTRRASVAENNRKHKQKNIDLELADNIAKNCESREDFYRKIGLTRTGFDNTCRRQGIKSTVWLSERFSGSLHNHKVVSIEIIHLDAPVPVYDIEVENYHNFAVGSDRIIELQRGVSCGDDYVFVHNSSKATLAQEDIRFSRTISVIQKTVIAELNKLAIIHLYAHGFDAEELQNFTLRMSNPSTVAQQQKLELWRAKFEIAGTAPEGQMSKEFIRKEIWGLNDEQCKAIDDQRLKEKLVDAAIEGAQAPDAGGDESMDVGDEGGEEPAGEEPADDEGGAEDLFAGDNISDKDPSLGLLVASDDPDDDSFPINFSVSDIEVPVRAQKQLDRALYNRGRIRHSGASKTHMPDFNDMTSADNKSYDDPYDMKWTNSYIKNPFGESVSRPKARTPIGNDVMSTLRKMSLSPKFSAHIQQKTEATGLINEIFEPPADQKEYNEVLIIDEDGSDK